MSRTARIDPQAVLAGYQKWNLEAILVCNLYYQRRPERRIVCASGVGVAYLLANPTMLKYAESSDAIRWADAIFGKEYVLGHTQGFSLDIPLESWKHWQPEGREREGHLDGYECRQLVESHGIRIIGMFHGWDSLKAEEVSPVQADKSAVEEQRTVDIPGE